MANTFKNAHSANVATSYATIYTATGVTTVILGMSLCNKSAATITASVQMQDAGSAARVMLNDVSIPAGSTLEVLSGQKYILENTDTIQAKASAANALDVVMGVMEIS